MPLEDELQAFERDRREHVDNVIAPALQSGAVVVLDRYYYSTLAYQGSRGPNVTDVDRRMRAIAPTPDVVVLLDVPPEIGLTRIKADPNSLP